MSDNFFDGKRVLITGASGFIGSHMVKRIVQEHENADVSIMVRENSDLWRIEEILEYVNIHHIDLRDTQSVNNCIKKIKPEYIFHFAAYGVDARQREYSEAINTNIIGTINILTAAGNSGCIKFINTGSCAEYGNKDEIINEKAVLSPLSIYGSTKASAVIIAHQIAYERNIDIVTLRSFGVFGENEGSHKFFPYLILSTLKGQEVNLTLCEQYRDYCYIENIIDGFILAAKSKSSMGEIYNIGSGKIHEMRHFVDLVCKHMNLKGLKDAKKKPNYGAIPYRENEMWKQQADISKIRKDLGWKPLISLEEGIMRTIEWYKNNQDKYNNIVGR